jgi:hypothetical protein
VPFTAIGLQDADRLLGHLSLNHPQTSLMLTNFDPSWMKIAWKMRQGSQGAWKKWKAPPLGKP